MERSPRPQRVGFDALSAPDYPPASSNQRLLAAEVRPEAVRALLRLHPIWVVKSDRGSWSVVAGLRSYRLARAVLSKNERERIPVIEVDSATGEFLGQVDQFLTPVLAEDVPADRREQWTRVSASVGHRLLRAAGFIETASRFQVPPARTEKRPSSEESS